LGTIVLCKITNPSSALRDISIRYRDKSSVLSYALEDNTEYKTILSSAKPLLRENHIFNLGSNQ